MTRLALMKILKKYFPQLSSLQVQQFSELERLYNYWNERVNLISRKDIGNLYEHHVLHSLAIGIFHPFKPGQKVMDVGTGGGFPGIPLAILFPDTHFYLIDSIAKKIKVVNEIANSLNLENIQAEQIRAEDVKAKFNYVVSRAVTPVILTEPDNSTSPSISLQMETVYYWAVDEIDSFAQTHPGDLWQFTTQQRPTSTLIGDLNLDSIVDWKDIPLFAGQWACTGISAFRLSKFRTWCMNASSLVCSVGSCWPS